MCWGNLTFDHAVSPSVGNSGGILCVWDSNTFIKDHVSSSDYFLAIMGTWTPTATKLLVISVYAPQDVSEKRDLWDYLCTMINRWEGETVVMGDFNEVRTEQERFGTYFNIHGANVFNKFISLAGLVDIPLGGYSYTWAHKSASKMSKLDRFLISEGLLIDFPNLSGLCLDRHLSDHRPIIMCESKLDYGPIPFRMFHSWFLMEGFDKFVEEKWNDMNVMDSNALIRLKKKLQLLKVEIKAWVKERRNHISKAKTSTKCMLTEVDKIIDQGKWDDDILIKRASLMKELNEINSKEALDVSQKAKIRWSIEGDENSKYFHGILNSKRSQLSIWGILHNGDWIVDPIRVKAKFFNHFLNQFLNPSTTRISLDSYFPNRFKAEKAEDLECNISYDEIKKAVWDCGTNKSPGPDGFTFEFFQKFWNIMSNDIFAVVTQFFSTGIFPPGCNSNFIALILKTQDAKVIKDFRPISLIGSIYKIISKILANRLSMVISDLINEVQTAFVPNRQILDGPFIPNELISWCKHKKINAMIFKIDFEKAFDSVRWDYLDDILKSFGFGDKWRSWIAGCLNSAKGSVLINGSPTSEFRFHRGLKQGDPLSPFLFILAMESLHLIEAAAIGLLKLERLITLSCGGRLTVSNRNFFNGSVKEDRKMTLIRWENILASKSKGGDSVLKTSHPRIFALESRKNISVAEKMNSASLDASFRRKPIGGAEEEQFMNLVSITSHVLLPQTVDRWSWTLKGSGNFMVSSVRRYIDDENLPKCDVPTRWVKMIPIKSNILAWKISLDRLPTRLNLSARGLEIQSILLIAIKQFKYQADKWNMVVTSSKLLHCVDKNNTT
ncbi:RNA-directed DNA polymerase, eukaryota [Tanacetum coccineum]